MKKLVIIGLTLGLLIVVALVFWHRQTHPSDSAISQKLHGTWVPNIADGRSRTLTLSADGHWTDMIAGKIRTGRMDGTWLVRDGCLISTMISNDLDMQVPFTSSSRIIRIDSHEYVSQGRNGEVVNKRIEP